VQLSLSPTEFSILHSIINKSESINEKTNILIVRSKNGSHQLRKISHLCKGITRTASNIADSAPPPGHEELRKKLNETTIGKAEKENFEFPDAYIQLNEMEANCLTIIREISTYEREIERNNQNEIIHNITKDVLLLSREISNEITQIMDSISLNPDWSTKHKGLTNIEFIGDLEERISKLEKTLNNNKHEELLESFKRNLEETSSELEIIINNAREDTKTKTSEILEVTKKEKEKISNNIQEFENLLSVLTGAIISEKYDHYATEEKTIADNLRYATIACLAAGIVATIGIFIESFFVSAGIEAIALRFAIIFSIALPAAYLAKESEKHRTMQHKFRRIDLDLKAIKPYLSSLPDDMQHRIRGEIAHKLFGQSDNEIDKQAFPVDIHELIVELIKNTKTSLTPERKSSN